MAFKLRMAFTGLCAFVPNEREDAEVKMCVVLPDGNTNVPRVGPDNSSLKRHRGFIQLKVGQIAGIPTPLRSTDADVITYLDRHRITLNCTPAGKRKFPGFYKSSLNQVANLAEMIPGFATPDPAIASDVPPRTVLAQVLLHVGQLLPNLDPLKLGRWVFPRSVAYPGFRGELTSEVALEIEDLEEVELIATSFDDTSKQTTWALKANDGETVEIVIANLCDENPLRWDVARRPRIVPDEDFRWYYTLLPNSLQSRLLGQLSGHPFPIPTPSLEQPNGIGRNCVPGTTAAIRYDLDSHLPGRASRPLKKAKPNRLTALAPQLSAQERDILEMSDQTIGRSSSLRKGWEYLAQVSRAAPSALASRSISRNDFQGEVAFRLVDARGTFTEVELTRLGFTSPGIQTKQGWTGRISLSGTGRGSLVQTGDRLWSLEVPVVARVLYRAVEDEKGFTRVDQGLYLPEFEAFEGTILADLADPDGDGELVATEGSLDLLWKSQGLGWIEGLSIPLNNVPMANLAALSRHAALAAPAAASNGCPGKRRLRLQPHAFHEGDPQDHSGASWDAQLKAAQEVWGGCCLDLVAEPIIVHEMPELRRSSDPSQIRDSIPEDDHQPDLIEVILVDNDLVGDGGGASFSVTTSLARVVMSNQNVGNPTLLAHEIGHVLGGLHPDDQERDGLWVAAAGTILDPSGSSHLPNLHPTNNANNCQNIRNDALIQMGEGCCISIAA
jgi:hypothetical protein